MASIVRSILTLLVAAVMLFIPFQLAFASSPTDFYYQVNPVYVQVTSNSVLPNGIPFCAGGALICYTPSFIRTAYNFPATSVLNGSGQTIIIVDAFGSPTINHDLAVFDQVFGLPAPPSFKVICPDGCPAFNPNDKNPHDEIGWAFETSLDVEWAHAMAPEANIVLVVASSNSGNAINTAEAKAIALYPGSIISQSFGIPEYLVTGNNAQILQAHKNYMQAQKEQITVFASAGDSGATNGIATPNANYPSSDPLVTAVGGTMGLPYAPNFTASPCTSSTCSAGLATFDNSSGLCHVSRPTLVFTCSVTGYGAEQVWNEPNYAAAGGGAPSLLFPVPSFQSGMGLASRTTPDVSYNAAVNGGVLVYVSFPGIPTGFYVVGGTSAGSPQWAAIAALANQKAGHPLGYLNPLLYSIGKGSDYSSDFHDITTGNNKLVGTSVGFTAGTGWDDATGWGTPNVSNLINDLAK
ncbi:MAG: S53 family peptidase [Conexivisphaerales archaeon]